MFSVKPISTEKEWEEFITKEAGKSTSPTSFIQSWNWGEFLVKQGQNTYRLGIYDDDKLIGLMLGTRVCAKRGKYLHFRHGPVMDWENADLVKFLLKELKNLALEQCVSFIRISPLISTQIPHPILYNQSFASQMHDVDAEETWVLDLNKSEADLLAGMRKNTRYSIRKAEKLGVEIIRTKDPKFLKIFWEIMQDTVDRKKWTFYSFDFIKNEFETFAENGQALLFFAKYKEKYISAAMFIFYHDQSVYHHSGNLSEFMKIPSSYLIQWEAIKEAKKRGLTKHNFWGLPLTNDDELDMNDPWTGVGLFKVGFGGRAERWIHARDIPVKWQYWLTHFYEKFESFKRKSMGKSN